MPDPSRQLTAIEREARGRAVRKTVPRRAHGAWKAPADRRDPVAVLEAQAGDRLPDLVPIRYGRMLASPFAFYRGSAAIMAMDLATTPSTGLTVQLCGDAHLANFGVFGSPERELFFDVNDFDETLPGPFEWDVKRLATSFVLAARANQFGPAEIHATALAVGEAYRRAMQRLAPLGGLATWYTHVSVEELRPVLARSRMPGQAQTFVSRTRANDSLKELSRLTRVVAGHPSIVDDPPLIERVPPEVEGRDPISWVHAAFHRYRQSLEDDRRHLLRQYNPLDVARKVVGVGSVGTRCYVLLLEGRDVDDPLFLQIKEAEHSVLAAYLPKSVYDNQGQRVVEGQRWLQAASDIFLGWQRGEDGRDYYWRQLTDLKGAVPVENITPAGLRLYAGVCGRTLARGHARSGDRIQIASYLGSSARFDEALAAFAGAYADQTDADYRRLVTAHKEGRIQAVTGK
ncbi:MAG: DUF2252 domain-containing protein [Chloroflexi bacterium]|nr:DUF2252 domain-containing protein [Chloroflexota bacterium]